MNIVLIGMRGSGKTTVAQILSTQLKKKYIEMDHLIVQKAGMPIKNIVAKHGWSHFRNIESEVAQEVSLLNDAIISTGGGVVIKPENIKAIKKNGFVVYLSTPISVLLERIGQDSERPALTAKKTPQEEMEEVLKKREAIYKKTADEVLDTEHFTAEEIALQIIEKVKNI